ncbi:MAG: hypothetical protein HWE07_13255 [Cytophagia bacterium]|nr:hypothetical protein [Cytophagia bacterium]
MNSYFIISERDAGLFSLIQQVIANLPRALNSKKIPIVYFGPRCCYWVPLGYRGSTNVWEYYFEPIFTNFASDTLPKEVKKFSEHVLKEGGEVGVAFNDNYYISNNFGDHSSLRNESLVIPYEWKDPSDWLRQVSSPIIKTFIRPKEYLINRARAFEEQYFKGNPIIGVHMRGTDALSEAEPRLFRKNSLVIDRYLNQLFLEKKRLPDAKIFVATDSHASLEAIRAIYGSDLLSSSTIMHKAGQLAGNGPTGALMPAYISSTPLVAAENGAEAIVDYLLLKKCNMLIHNGASLARTVLLSDPHLPHYNTHKKTLSAGLRSFSLRSRSILVFLQKLDERIQRNKKINFSSWEEFAKQLNDSVTNQKAR